MKYFRIIIPNYNNSKWLEKCISSIETQTFKDYQIIIIDDMSTDNSVNIIKGLQSKYDNNTKVRIKPIKTFTDIERGERVDRNSDPYMVTLPRAIYLENMGLIEIKE